VGNVYRTRDDKLRRTVAIKVLPDEVVEDPLRIERILARSPVSWVYKGS
jgi:hypothetical protein